jgi:hypothetical protein
MARVALAALAVKENIMSTGNLEGKIVAPDFWPSCETCVFFEACKMQPKHPAYPHTWHWGKETVSFPEGELVLLSWVGTAAIGDPHTACTSYAVDPRHVTEPLAHHQRYLTLERERQDLDVKLERFEKDGTFSKEAERLYEQLFHRFREITKEQRALRQVEAAKSAAA